MVTNAYLVISREMELTRPSDNWYEPEGCQIPEGTGRLADIVLARSHGHARFVFLKKHAWDLGDDLTSIESCRLVEKNIEREPGIVEYEDGLYTRLWKLSERLS